MGIPRGTARLLLDEARERPFSGALLELGRMTVYVTDAELARWAAQQRVPLTPLAAAELELSHVPALARLGCLSDRSFFRRLGFASVESAGFTVVDRPEAEVFICRRAEGASGPRAVDPARRGGRP